MAVPLLWAAALVVWVFHVAGRLGFNPTDEGFILAQSYRLLQGDVPHRDIISPRPLGSAFIHLVDYAVPLPLFESSRLVAIVQVLAYSVLFAVLIYGRNPGRWRALEALGAGASVLVNLNGFPLMAWHTIDGLMFIAFGLVLIEMSLEPQLSGLMDVGLLCLGTAPLIKQSFLLAPAFGLGRIAWSSRHGPAGAAFRVGIRAALVLMFPLFAYIGILAVFGALPPMAVQLAATRPEWGEGLISTFAREPARSELAKLLSVLAGLLFASSFFERGGRTWSPLASIAARAVSLCVVMWTALGQRLVSCPTSTWGMKLFWILSVVVLWRAVTQRVVDGAGLALLGVAWMATLSWGWGVPDLVAGSVALCALDRVWRGADRARPSVARLRLPLALAALAGAIATARTFVAARALPYYDRPRSELTAPLRPVSAYFGGIRTNPTTARYLGELVGCVRRYPARWVAVLPDNAWIYPALHLLSPFPAIWLYPGEFTGSESRLVDTAIDLDMRGEYLVLFQTFSAFDLPLRRELPQATDNSRAFLYDNPLGEYILARLHGTRVHCGSFVGQYFRGKRQRQVAGSSRGRGQ